MNQERVSSRGLQFLGTAGLLLYPYGKFIHFSDYPVWSPEVLLWILAAILVALFLTTVGSTPGFRAAVYAALVLFLITAAPKPIPPRDLYLRGLISFALFFFFLKIHRRVVIILFVFVLGLIGTDLFLFSWSHASLPKARPPVEEAPRDGGGTKPVGGHTLYLILDEHIGLEGMPPELSRTAEMKKKLSQFYLGNRFALHARAYSRYFNTKDAIPNVVNGTSVPKKGFYFEGDRGEPKTLKVNRLFRFFRDRGLALQVYQNNYINFCLSEPPPEKCYDYKKTSLAALKDQPFSWWEKSWVAGSLFLSTNSIYQEIDKRIDDRKIVQNRTGPLTTVPELLEELKRDFVAARQPTLFFAHLLMPHFPYIYDAECRPRPVQEWEGRFDFNGRGVRNSQAGYERKYNRYYSQLECLQRYLGDLFDFLKQTGQYDSTTIVIHGDHGSRINRYQDPQDFSENPSMQDVRNSYATLVALKASGQKEGRLVTDVEEVGQIIWGMLEGRQVAAPPEGEPFVFGGERKKHKKFAEFPIKFSD